MKEEEKRDEEDEEVEEAAPELEFKPVEGKGVQMYLQGITCCNLMIKGRVVR